MSTSERERWRLPERFKIYTECAQCRAWVEAEGSCARADVERARRLFHGHPSERELPDRGARDGRRCGLEHVGAEHALLEGAFDRLQQPDPGWGGPGGGPPRAG
ncbi:hypothetical protein AB3662_45060 [Sorangium cellulosum]|uniref:hypothetical protein n=1 Tax=Sorangium cellulosum TaxID=56 RepID=UPI003D9A22D8